MDFYYYVTWLKVLLYVSHFEQKIMFNKQKPIYVKTEPKTKNRTKTEAKNRKPKTENRKTEWFWFF